MSVTVISVLGAALLPIALQQVQRPLAIAPPGGSVLPDVVRQPGAWEPAAATGESRFLELPDAAASADDAQLSADGERLAYWVAADPGV